MRKYFINPETSILRAGWRIAGFIVIFIAIDGAAIFGIREILGGLPRTSNIPLYILAFSATVAVFIARKYLDKKPMTGLGLKWDRCAFMDIIFGVIISALIMADMFFLLLWTGMIEFNGLSWWTDSTGPDVSFQMTALPLIFSYFALMVAVGWWEELVFRGYILQNVAAGAGWIWAIVGTSLLFGFLHYSNPNATLLSSFLIAILTPILIYGYLKTGQLWLPMGFHLGWNFFQSSIFGFATSGMTAPSLISQTPVGPDWLSGGAFGVEGSIVQIPLLILSLYAIHWWVGKTRAPGQKLMEFKIEM